MDYPDTKLLPSLPDRMTYAMKQRGLVQESLAELAGCSQAAIQKILGGRTQKSKFLPDIARALDVDINWLTQGEPPSPASKHRDGAPVALELLSPWDDETPLDDDEIELPMYKEIELSSGHGRSEVQMIEGRKVRFSKRTLQAAGVDTSNAACATNAGNSNFPLILDRATLGIDRGMTRVVDGKIYALDHDGLLRIKFLYRLPGGGIRLRSFNRDEYEDESYTLDDVLEQRIVILGRVFWWSSLDPMGAPPLL
ncbi:XRE family transcriptional regulator [Pseudomonas aeruginosa]|uniref:XRE family transcriptional regulator n=1 Tax=Pseudomonas aeruginosa TaxID=287 RepID=UPI0005BD8CE3|nr:helix-turn-helix transcriptional regulator [Pseudomonas aeruginosa]MCV0165222.1 helix-turn-helix transcriptional regulator [Pseudomonas aeruginosa]TES04093.1 helix-turn-helix transcriptional regulator [Pseudomonas aeruginosa]TYS94138.1 helix-turn-helix transcriptional regulator [Pseudomonas aeruginosa]HBO2969468.1 helix-turn-helix transcriptional regulator [Pseudomonas aeruginosa]HBO4175271.1 helix-turn-helix transcriptional regulator [Pseudomonas aeruginosa]